jgi:acyl-homoserine lactone acylase PvdQ
MKIERDEFGVPIIETNDLEELFFLFGYAQAEDHLLPMLLNFKEAMGRLSEVLGEEGIERDLRSRAYAMDRFAERDLRLASDEERRILRAFVDGINRFISDKENSLPEWAREGVDEKEVLAFLRWCILPFGEGRTLNKIWMSFGSNQFAISPKRTRDGSTILSIAPHLPFQRPFQWYEAHLRGAGFDVRGVSFFGIPMITMGHNRDIAWSYTVNPVNVGDVYEAKLSLSGDKYFYEGSWREIEEEEIELNFKEGNGVKKIKFKLKRTHHGPIIYEEDGKAYSIRLSLFDAESILSFLIRVAKARNLKEFKEAFRRPGFHMFNVLYGDREGNIYYLCNALAPIRSPNYDWSKPVPGWLRETEWQGFHPFEKLPQIENPPCGYLQNCNVDPTHITVEQYLRWEDFPPFLLEPAFTGRSKRLLALLEGNSAISLEDAIAYSFDVWDMTAEEWKPRLIGEYNALIHEIKEGREILAKAINLLREWDNKDDLESRGSYLFGLWAEKFSQREDKDEMGMLLELISAGEEMLRRFGRLDVKWGDFHIIKRGDREYLTAGAGFSATESLHLATGRLREDGKVEGEMGTSFLMIVEFGERVRSWSLLPFGNSENPESPHFADQAPLFSERRLKPAYEGDSA